MATAGCIRGGGRGGPKVRGTTRTTPEFDDEDGIGAVGAAEEEGSGEKDELVVDGSGAVLPFVDGS